MPCYGFIASNYYIIRYWLFSTNAIFDKKCKTASRELQIIKP